MWRILVFAAGFFAAAWLIGAAVEIIRQSAVPLIVIVTVSLVGLAAWRLYRWRKSFWH